MRYLYENHLGGIFVSDELIPYKDLYCEECGDSDWFIGTFESLEEFWDLVQYDCDVDGNGGYSLQYIYPFMLLTFDGMESKARYDGKNSWVDEICSNTDEEILKYIAEAIEEEETSKGKDTGND